MLHSRRQFLIHGIQVSAALPLLHSGAPFLAAPNDDPILVVVQLTGGNDGLNMVVPHHQDAYFRMRPTLAHAPNALVKLDDEHGLHPRMSALGELYQEGDLAVLQGVGYPGPNRSHFRSMDIWHTADLVNEDQRLGWLGRMADQMQRAEPERLVALHVGSGELPLALHGERSFAPTARGKSSFQLKGRADFGAARDALLLAGAGQTGELAFLGAAARSTYHAAERMLSVDASGAGVGYPGYALAQELKLVAQLIQSNFGPRIFNLELTGFDTHVRQARTQAALLGSLSESLAAFQRDLEQKGKQDQVLCLVFSEFGRRAAENQSGGTDHGVAAPCFLLGSRVRGGLHGESPRLDALVDGDVPHSTDFRSLYSTLESQWMGLASSSPLPCLDLLT